jgi:hypothetical protein
VNDKLERSLSDRSPTERDPLADVIGIENEIVDMANSILKSEKHSDAQKEVVQAQIASFQSAFRLMLKFIEFASIHPVFTENAETTAQTVRALLKAVSSLMTAPMILFADLGSDHARKQFKENLARQTAAATKTRAESKIARQEFMRESVLRFHPNSNKFRLTNALRQLLLETLDRAGIDSVSDQTLRSDGQEILDQRAAKR